ncbi:MAG TPA: Holliday junction resolvase RuvX [Candidatus Saccharimonadales bacterium]|nr:Holliday junction resolvase RuvX [Candidatus Saccharimonadales bacterium]
MAVQRNFLSLDVGKVRIGLAIANSISKLPSPVTTLPNDQDFLVELNKLIAENQINELVVGLPKSLEGNDTDQTIWLREFYENLKTKLDIPIHLENEALSSVRAETELKNIGRVYSKEDVDALAACFILDDFIKNNPEL